MTQMAQAAVEAGPQVAEGLADAEASAGVVARKVPVGAVQTRQTVAPVSRISRAARFRRLISRATATRPMRRCKPSAAAINSARMRVLPQLEQREIQLIRLCFKERSDRAQRLAVRAGPVAQAALVTSAPVAAILATLASVRLVTPQRLLTQEAVRAVLRAQAAVAVVSAGDPVALAVQVAVVRAEAASEAVVAAAEDVAVVAQGPAASLRAAAAVPVRERADFSASARIATDTRSTIRTATRR